MFMRREHIDVGDMHVAAGAGAGARRHGDDEHEDEEEEEEEEGEEEEGEEERTCGGVGRNTLAGEHEHESLSREDAKLEGPREQCGTRSTRQ